MVQPNTRILRLPEVIRTTGLSRSSVYAKESSGIFPKHIKLGLRCSGWLESEITDWITARVVESRKSNR